VGSGGGELRTGRLTRGFPQPRGEGRRVRRVFELPAGASVADTSVASKKLLRKTGG